MTTPSLNYLDTTGVTSEATATNVVSLSSKGETTIATIDDDKTAGHDKGLPGQGHALGSDLILGVRSENAVQISA